MVTEKQKNSCNFMNNLQTELPVLLLGCTLVVASFYIVDYLKVLILDAFSEGRINATQAGYLQ